MIKKYADVVKILLKTDEEICFNLFSFIFEDENAFIKTDMKSYIIAQTNAQTTIWMWVSPLMEDTDVVLQELVSRILLNKKVHINTTPEYGEKILQLAAVQLGMKYRILLPMNVYICHNMKNFPRKGHIVMPCERHRELLINMTQQMAEATGRNMSGSSADAVVTDMICSKTLFLWESEEGKIVSMAKIDHEAEYGRINNVVTDLKYRGKGYASMLVSELCQKLFARNVIPMLYADSRNCSSNRMYTKIGFELVGNITEYDMVNV